MLEGVLNFIKEEKVEEKKIEETKAYDKSNGTDENILMCADTKNWTEELKEKFEEQIQDIEEESSNKQKESKSFEKMIMEQLDLLNDIQFIQNNYNVVTSIVYS